MAIAAIAGNVARSAAKYAPAVVDQAVQLAQKATGGKVGSVAAIEKYVGNSAQRLSVVTGALARAGISADDLVPADMAGTNAQLAQIRKSLLGIVSGMRSHYDSGADSSLNDGVEGDIIRKERVQAALRIYGNERAYFLCHPNGGIPRADFAWYAALFGRR